MDELVAAAAVVAMAVDDFAEEDLAQYAPCGAAAVDEAHYPAAAVMEADEEKDQAEVATMGMGVVARVRYW